MTINIIVAIVLLCYRPMQVISVSPEACQNYYAKCLLEKGANETNILKCMQERK